MGLMADIRIKKRKRMRSKEIRALSEELKTLYQAQAKFKSAENAKRIELQK